MPLFPEVSYLGNELIIDIICFSLDILREKLIRRKLLHNKQYDPIILFQVFQTYCLGKGMFTESNEHKFYSFSDLSTLNPTKFFVLFVLGCGSLISQQKSNSFFQPEIYTTEH